MAVKKGNTRIIITVSEKQADWLRKTASKTNMSVSKLIKWLMDKNIARLASWMTDEEFKTLRKIAKTPWIKLDNEDD